MSARARVGKGPLHSFNGRAPASTSSSSSSPPGGFWDAQHEKELAEEAQAWWGSCRSRDWASVADSGSAGRRNKAPQASQRLRRAKQRIVS